MPDEIKGSSPEEPFLDIDSPSSSSGSYTVGFILVIIVSVLICGFFVYYKFHTDSVAADKEATLESLVSTLNSKNNSEAEKRVNDVNAAIKILRTEKKSKYLFKNFIDELKAKTTNDVKLNNLSIDSEGMLSIDGESVTYKSVAELAISLKSSEKLDNVEIKSLSKSSSTEGENYINFSITANLTDWKSSSSGNSLESTESETGASITM